jgi:hypothetical protein
LSLPDKSTHIYDVINEQKFDVNIPERKIEERTLQLVLNEANFDKKTILKENEWGRKMWLEPEDITLQNFLVPSVNTHLIKCHYFLEL